MFRFVQNKCEHLKKAGHRQTLCAGHTYLMLESLTLSNFPEKQCRILREMSSTRPRIWLLQKNGVSAIIKDFSSNRYLYRNTVGRFLIWREARAYRKTGHIQGVPSLYRVIDGLALATEYIPGKDLGQIKKGARFPDTFFDRLKNLVDKVHAAGVAHCDLKRKTNVILGDDNLPYIIDWGASIFSNEFRLPLMNLIYRRFIADDYMAVTKIKLHYVPNQVSEKERLRYFRRSPVETAIRRIRDMLRNALQKIA